MFENQLAGAALLGVVSNFILNKVFPFISSWLLEIEKKFTTTITINDNEFNSTYFFLVEEYFLKKIKKRNYHFQGSSPQIGYGQYFLWDKSPIIISKNRITQQNNHYNELYIKAWFYNDLLTDLQTFIKTKQKQEEYIYIYYGSSIYSRKRDLNRKLLTQQQIDIYNKIKDFFENPKNKLTFLFSGLPGTGKTKSILNIAHLLNKNIRLVKIEKTTTSTHLINELLSGQNEIILLEDIDRLPITKDDDNPDYLINKGDLLNVLDGVIEINNCVIIATTNFKNKLDPALIRSGRFDNHIEFTLPSENDIKQIANLYNKDELFIKNNIGKTLAEIMACV